MSWTLIEHQALTSSVASVTLGSGGTIPQTYKTLKLVVAARSDNASNVYRLIRLALNGTTTNYSVREVYGNGSSVGSGNDLNNGIGYIPAGLVTSNVFANLEYNFPNYSGNTNKPVSADSVVENNATSSLQDMQALLWSNTAAITYMTLTTDAGNFVSGSTFTLYGLA